MMRTRPRRSTNASSSPDFTIQTPLVYVSAICALPFAASGSDHSELHLSFLLDDEDGVEAREDEGTPHDALRRRNDDELAAFPRQASVRVREEAQPWPVDELDGREVDHDRVRAAERTLRLDERLEAARPYRGRCLPRGRSG